MGRELRADLDRQATRAAVPLAGDARYSRHVPQTRPVIGQPSDAEGRSRPHRRCGASRAWTEWKKASDSLDIVVTDATVFRRIRVFQCLTLSLPAKLYHWCSFLPRSLYRKGWADQNICFRNFVWRENMSNLKVVKHEVLRRPTSRRDNSLSVT